MIVKVREFLDPGFRYNKAGAPEQIINANVAF